MQVEIPNQAGLPTTANTGPTHAVRRQRQVSDGALVADVRCHELLNIWVISKR